jgi:metal-responsive CopG/Arc/MetJ family transcriptional regulator
MQIIIDIPEDIEKEITELCREMDMSRSEFVMQAIESTIMIVKFNQTEINKKKGFSETNLTSRDDVL